MASSLYNLALDFSKELNYTKAIMARQGDKGITVTVKPYLNGLQMDTSGGTFTLKGTTPSNRYVDSVATSVTSEEVTFSLDGTFMSEAGYYKHCYVEYRKDNQILTTQDIIFFSLGVSDISQGQADEYVSQLEELIRKYNETFDAFMAETKGRVDSLNQQITDLTGQAKTLQDKLDALKEEISKLGNLQVMYSNSINFGDYDYSGNPNLLSKLSYDLIENQNTSAGTLSKGENSFKYNKISAEVEGGVELYYKRRGIANWLPSNKTLVMTVKLRAGADYSPVDGKLILIRYRYVDSGTGKIVLDLPINSNSITQEWKEFSITGTTPTFSPQAYHPWIQFRAQDGILGEIEMSYDIKIEEGSTATPFQPNLLAEPYNMCREYPNENIADHTVKFPIESGDHQIYQGYTEEELMIGQTYTITLKGTKPASQTFVAYNHWTARLGELKPVDGLTDVWSLTFTPTNVVAMPKLFRVYQYPRSTVGACRIDWLKIEKGNTRTPNISQFKYFGEGLKDSNNPNDYSWDVTPEYTEKGLNNAVNVYDPQRVEGLKNFADGIQIAGDKVISENDCTVYTLTKDNSQSFIDGYATFIKHGKEVVVNGTVKFKKAYAFGVPLDDEVPDEFIARIVHGMLTGQSGTNSVSKAMYVQKDLGKIMTNSEFAANEWFTFHGNYWVGVK
ncbi:BppU family phage baseplate upper protein [Enterococcus faecium]